MEWPVILAIIVAITIILFPAMFIWYLNINGIHTSIRERGGIKVPTAVGRAIRIVMVVVIPAAIYAVLIWFFYGHFGWQVALAVALVFPIVLFVPALIWMAISSGLYQVARDRARRRSMASRRKTGKLVEEPVGRRMT